MMTPALDHDLRLLQCVEDLAIDKLVLTSAITDAAARRLREGLWAVNVLCWRPRTIGEPKGRISP